MPGPAGVGVGGVLPDYIDTLALGRTRSILFPCVGLTTGRLGKCYFLLSCESAEVLWTQITETSITHDYVVFLFLGSGLVRFRPDCRCNGSRVY